MTKMTLKEQVAALATENNQVLERWEDAQAQIKSLERSIDRRDDEIRSLREQLHESEMRRSELQGYIKAMSDQTPPRMVPEVRSTHAADLMRDTRPNEYEQSVRPKWFNQPQPIDEIPF